MKNIEEHQLGSFTEHYATFFTNEGIIIDNLTGSPLLHFSSTVQKLGINVGHVYLDDSILVVQCQLSRHLNKTLKEQFRIHPTKSFLAETNAQIQQRLLRAIHWLTWDAKSQYCSKCGGKLHKVNDLVEKQCAACQASFFPNLAPAIMVLIQRDNEILLARSAHFKPGVYSAIAGFIDVGETAEQAVHREVKEEVGIEISQLEYFGSQSWPFPNSFMLAFKAHYLQGNLKIDANEIEDAQWFNLNNLPELPANSSISRKLIDSWRLKKC